MDQHPAIEDLRGAATSDHDADSYFDHREFAARASMEDEHYWHLARREFLLQTLQTTVKADDAPLLEIGCGAGTVATFLNEHGFEVDYADVHQDALALARKRASDRLGDRVARRRFIRMDVCHDEVPGGYAAILLLDVIEHLPDDAATLTSVHRALDRSEAKGLLILTVPAFPILWSPYDVVEHHKRRYTRASARAVLEACDFEILKMSYFFSPLFFASGAVKLARSVSKVVRPRAEPELFTELVETRAGPTVTRAMMSVLRAERGFLRKHDLPVGTSLLCIARPR